MNLLLIYSLSDEFVINYSLSDEFVINILVKWWINILLVNILSVKWWICY